MMEKVGAHDETTLDSGSGGSAYSDLSALENETDELGRRILQHQRDLQRLNNVLKPGQKPFRNARPRPRRLVEPESRDNPQREVREIDRLVQAETNEAEPPLNVPRQWGHRARRKPNWLSERNVAGETQQDALRQEGKADKDAIIPHRTLYTGDEDWAAIVDEPIASVEDTPPSMRRRRRDTTPTSLGHMNSTFNEDLAGVDADFANASILASTPAVNRRNRRIDEMTRREIEAIERRGVTKRTLEQIIEQSSPKRPGGRPVSAPSGETADLGTQQQVLDKENLPPNKEANGSLKRSETLTIAKRIAEPVIFDNTQRPTHRRNDSYNLLKRLARVSSLSPSPARPQSEPDFAKTAPKVMQKSDADSTPSSEGKNKPPATVVNGRLQHAPETTPEITPAEKKDSQPEGLSDSAPPTQDFDVTPAPVAAYDAKTPVVTGAWVDTPAAQTDVRPLLKATDSTIVRAFGTPSGAAALEPQSDPLQSEHRRVASEPINVNSALADVLKEVKSQPDAPFGEATIQSLEDILNPEGDTTDPTLTADITEAIEHALQYQEADDSLTQAEKDRRLERLAIEAMNKHLRAARTSIKDANRGLRRVENQIESVQTVEPTQGTATTSCTAMTTRAQTANGRPICPTCGKPSYKSTWHALWFEFLSCFYTYHPPYRIRLTWFGLAVVIFAAWYIIESMLCSIYCHKLYAARMIDYGVDPDAPIWPFVIPTLLFRPFRPIWEPALEWLVSYFGIHGQDYYDYFNGMEVRERGSVEPVGRNLYDYEVDAGVRTSGYAWTKTAATAFASETARVVRSLVDAVDEVGSMWDDTLLG